MKKQSEQLGISRRIVSKAVKQEGGKSLVRKENSLLTPRIKRTHLTRCMGLFNDLKCAPAGGVVILSDEEPKTVNPVQNRQNDRIISFGNFGIEHT